MKLKTEQHSGECGRCGTAVPIDERQCDECNAKWGLDYGRDRQQHFNEYFGKFIIYTVLTIMSLVVFISSYEEPGAGKVNLVSGLVLLFSFCKAYGLMLQLRRAKKGELAWWR